MAVNTPVQLDPERIRELTERERAKLDERTQASRAMYERARESLSGGVASTYQAREPWPIYLTHGEGPVVWDVDGNQMWDFHNGFGSMVQGHAHPAIVRAVSERVGLGTHFAATTEDGVVVAETTPDSLAANLGSAAGAWRAGATSTPARRRRWTRSGSPAATPAARRS